MSASSPSDSYDHGSTAGTRVPWGRLEDLKNVPGSILEAVILAITSIQIADQTNSSFTYPSKGSLPGRGGSYDDCGSLIPYVCESCGDVSPNSRRCQRSMCPECWESWAMDRATEIGSRILALRAKLDARTTDHVKAHHVTFSLPWMSTFATETRENATKRAMHAVRDILHALGIPAVVIYHPYRIADDAVDWSDLDLDDEWIDKQGEWKRVLNQGETMADVQDDLVFAPHFHVIAVCPYFPGGRFTKRFYEATGWIVHRITKESSNASIYDNEDLAAVLTYLLSHAEIYETDQGYRCRYSYYGKDNIWNDVEVQDHYKKDFQSEVRKVAPRTLGVGINETTCVTKVREAATYSVDVRAATAGAIDVDDTMSTASRTELPAKNDSDVTGEVEIGAGNTGTDADAGGVPDDPGMAADPGDVEPCHGRLIPPWKARDLLIDEDWMAQAEHADRAAGAVHEWYADEEEDPPPVLEG